MTKEFIELSKIPCLSESNASWTENVVYITIDDKTVLEFRIGDTTVRMTSDGLLKLIIDNGGEVVVNGGEFNYCPNCGRRIELSK